MQCKASSAWGRDFRRTVYDRLAGAIALLDVRSYFDDDRAVLRMPTASGKAAGVIVSAFAADKHEEDGVMIEMESSRDDQRQSPNCEKQQNHRASIRSDHSTHQHAVQRSLDEIDWSKIALDVDALGISRLTSGTPPDAVDHRKC